MYCNNCGAEIDDNSRFCINCGQQINNFNSVNDMNNNFDTAEGQQQEYANNQQNGNVNNSGPQFVNTLSYEPIGMWGYFGYELLFSIPVIGFILAIIFSITSNNVNVKNFARAYFIMFIFGVIILFIVYVTLGISIFDFLHRL